MFHITAATLVKCHWLKQGKQEVNSLKESLVIPWKILLADLHLYHYHLDPEHVYQSNMKERISFKHQYNCRTDPNEPNRGKVSPFVGKQTCFVFTCQSSIFVSFFSSSMEALCGTELGLTAWNTFEFLFVMENVFSCGS